MFFDWSSNLNIHKMYELDRNIESQLFINFHNMALKY